jgi:hypothetical protein
MARTDEENRRKQIVGGISILVVLMVLVCGTIAGWRYLPGLLGEWIGMMIGVLTTPFFLEGSFLMLGLTIVLVLNIWRRNRDGDDFVDLVEMDEANLPEHAKWAAYRTAQMEDEVPGLQAQAEELERELGDASVPKKAETQADSRRS